MRSDLLAALLGTAIVCIAPAVAASPTTFTYQGHLAQAGNPAEGAHEFEVRLLDGLGAQIGLTQTASEIVTAGAFAMELDFGNAAFDGSERYLEISVRSVAGGAYVVLTPNQLVTSTPVAQFALAGNEGPTGSQGIQGNPGTDGLDGAPGSQGPQGNQGIPGNDGLDGVDGSTGPQGIQGNTGPTGPQGNPGDSHWTLNGSATYYNAGNIGIGTDSPGFLLDVRSTNAFGIFGEATGSNGNSVWGLSSALTGNGRGVYGESKSTGGRGVTGMASALTGDTMGVIGISNSTSGKGVLGSADAFSGNTIGVHGISHSTSGRGVYGESTSVLGSGIGGGFRSDGATGKGVDAVANHSSGANYAGYFVSQSTSGTGIFAITGAGTGTTYAVRAQSTSPDGYAGYFVGGKNYFSGNVGIGTTSPSDKLHISVPATTDALRIQTGGITRIRVNANGGVALGGNSTIIGAGDVYIANRLGIGTNAPTFDLSVSGTAAKTGGGSWAVFSDQRLKKNITSMTGSLDTISALRPVNFEYTAKDHFSYTPGVQFGFIAQEVQQVIPQWVNMADDGYFYLDQVGYEALIVDAIQELRAEKDAEIQQLQARLDRLERMMTLSIDR